MRFANTLILLVALVSGVAVPLFVGHGLSTHSGAWLLSGLGAAVAAAALMALHVRMLGDPRG